MTVGFYFLSSATVNVGRREVRRTDVRSLCAMASMRRTSEVQWLRGQCYRVIPSNFCDKTAMDPTWVIKGF